MQKQVKLIGLVAVILAVGLWTAVAAEEEDQVIQLKQAPEVVQKTILKSATEAQIKKIAKADEDGKVVYEVDVVKGTQKIEITVAPDGKLLSSEEEVAFADVPEAARKTIQGQAGATEVKTVDKVTTDGKVIYEYIVTKGDKKTEIEVAPDGKVVGTEDMSKKKD